jgi:hypothetical protein
MDLENDPEFWKWLIEQQKHQNKQDDTFQPLVLELPLPPPQWRPEEPEDYQDKSPEQDYDTFDDYVIFEL